MNKINFVGFISVDHANPNGNPLDDNKPRVDDQSFGEISQFCIRRKVRNRLMAVGQPIFVQSDSNRLDGYETLSARLSGELDLSKYTNPRQLAEAAADKWLDVRAFGQPLEFKGKTNNSSAHVRGAISIGPAFSVDPVCIERVEIPKGLNNSRYLVQYGLYRFFGGIDVDLAEKNHLSEDDIDAVIEAVRTMFVGDASAARPKGSMKMVKLIVVKHDSKIGSVSTRTITRTIKVSLKAGVDIPHSINDYNIDVSGLNAVAGIDVSEIHE